jgi:hypothetical protein
MGLIMGLIMGLDEGGVEKLLDGEERQALVRLEVGAGEPFQRMASHIFGMPVNRPSASSSSLRNSPMR